MPWTVADVAGKTKKANTLSLKKRWVAIANRLLAHDQKKSISIKIANAAIAKAVTQSA